MGKCFSKCCFVCGDKEVIEGIMEVKEAIEDLNEDIRDAMNDFDENEFVEKNIK